MVSRTSALRITLTSPYCWPEVVRGGERYVHELAAALRRAGHDVQILSSAPLATRTRVLGVPVTCIRRRPFRPGRYGPQAAEIGFGIQALVRLAGHPGDVWHATSAGDAAAASALGQLRPRVRSVFTDHGFPAAASRATRPDAGLHRYVVRHVSAYVCVSAAAASYLRSDYGRMAAVVPPGVQLANYAPGPRHRAPALLYAGSIDEPRKNVPLLLRTAALMRRTIPGLQVWLHGPGDVAAAIAAAGVPADLVTRSGSVPTSVLARAYASAWATVLPSRAESFGMAIVESFASGTPVVVLRDSGGPAELVTEDVGRCSDDGPAALSVACTEALALSQEPQTRDACRAVAEQYDWDARIVPRMLEVYRGG